MNRTKKNRTQRAINKKRTANTKQNDDDDDDAEDEEEEEAKKANAPKAIFKSHLAKSYRKL